MRAVAHRLVDRAQHLAELARIHCDTEPPSIALTWKWVVGVMETWRRRPLAAGRGAAEQIAKRAGLASRA